MTRLVIGTRGSDLARAQTSLVEAALRRVWPEIEIAVEIITTRGDESSSAGVSRAGGGETQARGVRQDGKSPQGRKGLFTREIERALRAGEIDLAVHSAKDLPSDADAELEVRAALPRAQVEDVFVAKEPRGFASLRAGSVVATGSVRRQHQLRGVKADVTMADLRGNVPTRLRKLIASEWDGIILARAGLERLGFAVEGGALRFEDSSLFVESLPQSDFLPAGGQGIIALQVRADDDATKQVVDAVNHRETLWCLRAEREFLRLLQGDCDSPVGVLAALEGGTQMRIRAQVFELGEPSPRCADAFGDLETLTPESIAAKLMEKLNGG